MEEWKTFLGPRESCHQEPPRVEGLPGSAPIPSIQQPLGLFVVVVVGEELAIEIAGALKTRARESIASLATTWALW